MYLISPLLRFTLRYPMLPGVIQGPRIAYTPSVYYIESGKGSLDIEGVHHPIVPGKQIYLAAGKVHTWHADEQDPLVFCCVFFEWFYLSRPWLHTKRDFICNQDEPIRMEHIAPSWIKEAEFRVSSDWQQANAWIERFERMLAYAAVVEPADFPDYLVAQGEFILFLNDLLEKLTGKQRVQDPRILKLLRQIEQAGEQADTEVAKWAASVGLSRSYLQALFKAETGTTPKQYWNHKRIERAKADLMGSTMSVTEIAEKYTYASVHVFSKAFRSMTGETPTNFRQRNRWE